MNNKTIAIVINTSWNIYNFRLGLMQALQEEGYRIIAIAPTDSYSPMIEALGFEFHNITMNNKGTNPLELKFPSFLRKRILVNANFENIRAH